MTNKEFAGAIMRYKGKISVPVDIEGAYCYVYANKKDLASQFEALGETPCHYSLKHEGQAGAYLNRIE